MAKRNQSQADEPLVDQGEAKSETFAAAEQAEPAPELAPMVGEEDGSPPKDGDPETVEPIETVLALVLYDSVYGKCGEVKEFPAHQAEAIAAAGYIDTHPNAIAAAE